MMGMVCLLGAFSAQADDPPPLTGNFHQTQIAGYLDLPWAAAENPLGGWLITERGGTIIEYTNAGQRLEIPLQIEQLYVAGQGGLLDIVLADDFTETRRVYLSFSVGDDDENYLAFGTAQLVGEKPQVERLFTVKTAKDTPVHFGGRLQQLADGSWLMTSGDGFDYREQAQQKNSFLGKVLRFNDDGSAPLDNPFYTTPDTPQSYIYTLGHRNPQGLVQDPLTGALWLNEHGPDGGDEINLLQSGSNYGWPVVTLGKDYSGAKISPFTHYDGMVDPRLNWTPSIAPSSLVIYQDSAFPELANHLLVSSLKNKALYAVALDQNPMSTMQIFATINERLRDVIVGRDGSVYI
ncbi:PQQ-dependent sugar dehydrogenase, partial [uncultured Alteromonas sp.]|uniref:PQQ-dependent sugar dehydrogenase n=1 Tax=uncultured Alteromonas sp. TaxID=179113 RepID=UPI0025FC30E4